MNAIQKFIEAEHKYLDLNEIDYKEYEQMVEPLRDVECVVRCKDCKHCPYEKDCTHHETCDILIRNALFVIESLQSENKILSENCDGLSKQRDDFAQTIHEQKMEIERLKAQKQKWLQNIADQQLAVSPTGWETEEGLAKRTGEWNGLQMAFEILTKE